MTRGCVVKDNLGREADHVYAGPRQAFVHSDARQNVTLDVTNAKQIEEALESIAVLSLTTPAVRSAGIA